MNRQELIEAVAAQTEQPLRAVERMLTALIDTIQNTVAEGEPVTLKGFGKFEAVPQLARQGRHPQTGETMFIPATIKPRFKPGVDFSKAVVAHQEVAI